MNPSSRAHYVWREVQPIKRQAEALLHAALEAVAPGTPVLLGVAALVAGALALRALMALRKSRGTATSAALGRGAADRTSTTSISSREVRE